MEKRNKFFACKKGVSNFLGHLFSYSFSNDANAIIMNSSLISILKQ